ncbi:MAG: LysR family transcriptional regulator [Terrimicrobiaceae bacterium]
MHRLFSKSGLSLERLRTFSEVATAGGISHAVPDDPTRQSQFSRQLKELEEFFEAKLLIRKRGRFELTAAGRELFQIVQAHFSALQELADRCSNQKIEVRVGAGESLLQWLLLPCLGSFHARHPSATLVLRNLQTDNILKKLAGGEIDIGIVRQEAVRAPLKCERLGQIEHRLVVPATKKSAGTDPWVLLGAHPVAVLDGSEVTRALERDATTRGIKLDIVVRTSSHAQLVEAVRGARCAAVLPTVVVSSTAQGMSSFLLSELRPYSRSLALAWNPRNCELRPSTLLILHDLAEGLKKKIQAAG